uniref:PTBP1-like RNA recognition motif 2 domain-containing protein n=1 Tax=Glossina morsitans morsitans TaxID=37546 RepID=A0A1B0FN38_GLOMM
MKCQHEIMQPTSYRLSYMQDVLHKICNPHGQVLRIVIFKKNGVQAMVEFDSLDAATRARENLNGADIYSGCCTLKIDFAKPEKLNVYKNEPDTSWDYTLTTGKFSFINFFTFFFSFFEYWLSALRRN